MSAEARLKELGIVLPSLPKPVANYLPYRLAGNMLYLVGAGPARRERQAVDRQARRRDQHRGRLPARQDRRAGPLAAMRDALGSLDRVDYIVKLLGMVNATPDFNDSPKVINGCSDSVC
jgi:hypothetical protein